MIIGYDVTQRKPKYPFDPKKRRSFMRSLGDKCIICNSQEKLELDHIDPIANKDFNTEYDNGTANLHFQILCKKHNNEKREVLKFTEINSINLMALYKASNKDLERVRQLLNEINEQK